MGNIHLRNDQMSVFKVCLTYDPKTVDEQVKQYGGIRFLNVYTNFCREHLSVRDYPPFLLEIKELKSKLPRNLLPLCPTSFHLSEFDEKLNEYCAKAQNKVKQLQILCDKKSAFIKEENG